MSIDKTESRKETCGIKNINSDMEIGMTVTQSRHLPTSCSGSATLKRMNGKDGGAILKLSDVDRGAHTIEFVTPRERQTINRLCSLGLIPGLNVKVLRAIPKGPIIIEVKRRTNRPGQGNCGVCFSYL